MQQYQNRIWREDICFEIGLISRTSTMIPSLRIQCSSEQFASCYYMEGRQRMRWLGSITYSMDMNLSKLCEIVKDREAWHAAVCVVTKNQTQFSDWPTATISIDVILKWYNKDDFYFHLIVRHIYDYSLLSINYLFLYNNTTCSNSKNIII